MSLPDCIPGLVEAGKIREGDGEKAERAYRRHYARLVQSMSPEAAAAQASEMALQELEYAAALAKRQAMLQVKVQQRILGDLGRYQGNRYQAFVAVLAEDQKAPFMNVAAQHKAVLGRLHGRAEAVLAKHSRNLIGEARDKTGLRDLVGERFGEDTGNRSANEVSEAFGTAAEYGRQRFNRAGGNIGKLDGWGMPTHHDELKVRWAGRESPQYKALEQAWRAARKAGNLAEPGAPPRTGPLPEALASPLTVSDNTGFLRQMKKHPRYAAAKAGDDAAADELVRALVPRAMLRQAGERFRGAAFLAPGAADGGRNRIPAAFARALAKAAGGEVAEGIVQRARAFHSGAEAMDRLVNRAVFDGQIEPGRRYVLVDDATTTGGTLADLAAFVRGKGGEVAGSSVMVNATRKPSLAPEAGHVAAIEAKFGDVVRRELGVEPASLTAAEAAYLAAFRDARTLGRRIAEARRGRRGRAGAREVGAVSQSAPAILRQMREVSYQAWRSEILNDDPNIGVDLGRMIDPETGQPFTPESFEEVMRASFETIRSDGWDKMTPGGAGKGKRANRRAEHRFFVFKNAEAWLRYHEKFGTGTPFDAMMGHLEGLSRDIALMEVMGPNPAATLKWMQDMVRQEAAVSNDAPASLGQRIAGTGSMLDVARSAEKRLGDLYDVVAGNLNTPVNTVWARRMGGTRAYLTSALLGSAPLSAISDMGFQAVTRGYNGLPITGAITGYVKLLNPLARADRRVAVRLGLIAEEASHRAAVLNRYIDGTHGPEMMLRVSDFVLRASGLSVWTQVGRWAFGMEVLGTLADYRYKAWLDVPERLRDMMLRYGIDADGWEGIRHTEPYRHQGRFGTAEFLRPDDIEDEGLGDALLRMVLTETDYAVPAATARSRAALSFGQRPGTIPGEVIRSAGLFKSFGVSMILAHGARMMAERGWNRAAYFGGLAITTGLLGYLGESLYAQVNGKDLPDPAEPSTWAKAELRGGGFGIFGDFLGSSVNRFGGGPAETLSGPVVGLAADIGRAGVRAVGHRSPSTGESTANPGGAAVDLARRYTPGGSIWYTRLAWNRLVLDQMQSWADPNYAQSWARMENTAERRGQPFWWGPGQTAPTRAPSVGQVPQ